MKKLLVCCLLFASVAEADVSNPLLEKFQSFATRDLIRFGAATGTTLSLEESLQGYFVHSGNVILGNALIFERCLVQLDKADINLTCHDGVSAVLDICKLEPSICQKEGSKQKLRELYVDPTVSSGETMSGIGQQTLNAHMRTLTRLAKKFATARQAIAQAMSLNGCTSIELGDIEGQITYLDRQPMADDETNDVVEGARNRWRAIINCRSASASVYLDVIQSVEEGRVHLNLVPIKATAAQGVLIDVVDPKLLPKR